MPLAPEVLEHTAKWMSFLHDDWVSDIPIRLHVSGFDRDGSPKLNPEFLSWLSGGGKNGDGRYRATKAMRRLRRASIREFEVAYRMVVLQEPMEGTTAWLNERAIRNGKPERYSMADTQTIIVAAVDKLLAYW